MASSICWIIPLSLCPIKLLKAGINCPFCNSHVTSRVQICTTHCLSSAILRSSRSHRSACCSSISILIIRSSSFWADCFLSISHGCLPWGWNRDVDGERLSDSGKQNHFKLLSISLCHNLSWKCLVFKDKCVIERKREDQCHLFCIFACVCLCLGFGTINSK